MQVLDISSTLYDRNYSANHQLGFTAPNLTPYTNYICRLAAFTVSEGPFVTMIIRTNESSEWIDVPQTHTLCVVCAFVKSHPPHTPQQLCYYFPVPGPPRINNVSESSRSIFVDWVPPLFPNGVIRGYRVEWRNNTRNGVSWPSSDETQIILENLQPHTQYSVIITANTSAGWGHSVNSISTTMEDGEWL